MNRNRYNTISKYWSESPKKCSVIRNNNKVCIFDIDNTLTIYEHLDSNKNVSRICAKHITSVKPAWPKQSGTTQYIIDTLRACDSKGFHIAIATAEAGKNAWSREQEQFLTFLGDKAGLRSSIIPENTIFGTFEWMDTPLYQNSCTALGYNRSNYCESVYCRDEPCEFSVTKIPSYMNILNYLKIDPNRYNQSIMFDDSLQNLTDANTLGLQTCQASPICGGVECRGGCGVPKSCIELINNQPVQKPTDTGTSTFTLPQYHPDKCA